jgi:hypothetical protein
MCLRAMRHRDKFPSAELPVCSAIEHDVAAPDGKFENHRDVIIEGFVPAACETRVSLLLLLLLRYLLLLLLLLLLPTQPPFGTAIGASACRSSCYLDNEDTRRMFVDSDQGQFIASLFPESMRTYSMF